MSEIKYIICKNSKDIHEAGNILEVERVILDFIKNGGNISEIKLYKVQSVNFNIKVNIVDEKQKLLY